MPVKPEGFFEAHRFKMAVVMLLLAAVGGSSALLPNVLAFAASAILARIGAPGASLVLLQLATQAAANVGSGFYQVCALILERFCGIQVAVEAVVPGQLGRHRHHMKRGVGLEEVLKPPPMGKTSVIICNHRTRLDWMLLWMVLARVPGALFALRIVLKAELALLPWFGWAMQSFRFVFMSRKWATDEARLAAAAASYRTVGDGNFVLIFPEGTDLHPAAVEKSAAFSKANNLPEFKHVLHPRATGLVALIEHLGPNLHEVIDITMGYEDFDPAGERPSEKSFFAGRVTRKLNVLVEVFRFAKLPAGTKKGDHACFYIEPFTGQSQADAVRKWLTEQFNTKEEQLAQYYSLPRPAKNPLSFSWHHVGTAMQLTVDNDAFMTRERGFVRIPESPGGAFKRTYAVPGMWALAAAYLILGQCTSNVDRTIVWGGMLFYIIESKLVGGIDQWLIYPTALRLSAALAPAKTASAAKAEVASPPTPSKEQKQS